MEYWEGGTALSGCKLGSTVLENNVVGCSVSEDVILPNLAITVVETLTRTSRDTDKNVHGIAGIALTWKQPKYPLTGEWTECGIVVSII